MPIDTSPCSNWAKINVADVSTDGGNTRSDATNSLIEIVNVIAHPARIPGIIRGNIIFLKI